MNEILIGEEINNLFKKINYNIICEASPHRQEILKKIDKDFSKLKDNPADSFARKSLVNHTKEFTGIKKVIIKIVEWDSAGMIPKYKDAYLNNFWSLLKKKFLKQTNTKRPIEEDFEMIGGLYIYFGTYLINNLTSKELTAVLLHEIGHCVTHSTRIINTLYYLISSSRYIGAGAASAFVKTPFAYGHPLFLPVTLSILILTRSLTFLEHLDELKSDNFASKYGYGDELITLTDKFRKIDKKYYEQMGILRKVFVIFMNTILPSSHPKDEKRICELADSMRNKYKDLYPYIRKDLSVILSDIKCDSRVHRIKYSI